MKRLLALFIALTFTTVTANEIQPTKAGIYKVDGFDMYLECYENDKPKLILEQGFGRYGSDAVWKKNIAKLQSSFSICLYDRAGLGKSEKAKVPFTVNDTANRLQKLLQQADITPPYYFAGGSYAAYIIRAYNNLFPNEVLGATLIAPPPFGYFYTMGNRWPKNFQSDNEQLMRYYQFEQSTHNPMFERVPENVDHMKSFQQLENAKPFGDKPVITVFSKKKAKRYDPEFVPDDIAAVMDNLYQNSEKFHLSLSSNSKVTYSSSTKHHLHIADGDLVVKSIEEMLSF